MKRVAANSGILIAVNVSGAGLGFWLSVVLARGLGVADFGRYTLAIAWAFALSLLAEFGLNTLITRDVARQPADASPYLAAATVIKTTLAAVLIAVLVIAAPALSPDPMTVVAIRWSAPLIGLNALYGSFTAVFRACERMVPILVLNAGGLLAQLALTYASLSGGGHLLEVVRIALGVQLGQIAAAYLIYRAHFRLTPARRFDLQLILRLGRSALPFALAGVLGAVQLRASVLLLGVLLSEIAVGLWGAAARWAEAVKIAPNAFFGALFPRLAALAGDRSPHLDRMFIQSERWLLVFAACAALALNLAARPILTLTYGADFALAVPVLQVLGWALIPALWNGLTALHLYAVGDESFVNWIGLFGLVVQIAAAIPLIGLWGAVGAAVAGLIGEVVMVIPLRVRRAQKRGELAIWPIPT